MIDRRLPFIQKLQEFLIDKNPDWQNSLVLEEPPLLEGVNEYEVAIPCFSLSKLRKTNPMALAEGVAMQLTSSSLSIEKAEAVKGYVNIRFKQALLGEALRERTSHFLGAAAQAYGGKKVAVDFSSPNIAKPFGIGHLRSTNIGAAICRIYQALGCEVVRINHLGDWGTQFGKMITAYKRFGTADFVKGDPINNLYKLYVQFHEKEKDDPALLDEAREWFVKLEEGNTEALELWKWFRDVSYNEFKRIYDRLGVEFDYVTGESFYNNLMPKTVERLEKSGLLQDSEGAKIVDLEALGMPPCLIKKSDGSTLYATRDLATAEYRAQTFHPDRLVYVVGSDQALHFRQFFAVLKLMGYEWAERCVHVGFGLIKFPEGKMSTRKGNLVLLEEVLDQAEKEAFQIVQTKNLEKSEERRLTVDEEIEVARLVGTGAVIFFDLHAKRMKDIIFNWKDILSFEGDSGPYLQYSCVRLGGILEKAKESGFVFSEKDVPEIHTPEERELARCLLGFPAAVEAAAREFEPSIVSHELLRLAAAFNRFYMNVPILKGEEHLRAGRLSFVKLTRDVLLFGLGLLGIDCPSKM